MSLRLGVEFELGQDVAERLLFAEAASVSGWVLDLGSWEKRELLVRLLV